MRHLVVCIVLSLAVLPAGCSRDIDKKKFEHAARAAQAVQASIDHLDDYETFGRVMDTFRMR